MTVVQSRKKVVVRFRVSGLQKKREDSEIGVLFNHQPLA